MCHIESSVLHNHCWADSFGRRHTGNMGQSESLSVSPEGQHDESYGYEVMTVEEINKIQLAKLIIKYCGHEGTTDDEQTASIRKLLQRAITNLEPLQKQYPGVWRNAQLKIFDLYGNGYLVKSGEGSVKFVAQITGKGDVELSKIKDGSFWASLKDLFTGQTVPQLQIEGAPPAQSNTGQGWFAYLKSKISSDPQPKESRAEGSSRNGNNNERRPSEPPSQIDPGSTSTNGDGTPLGTHQDQGLNGPGQVNGLASSPFNPNNTQPVDNLPGSESETGSDESGCASQDQLQPTGGTQTDKNEKGDSTVCDGYCLIG